MKKKNKSNIYKDGTESGSAKVFSTRFELCNHNAVPGTLKTDGRTHLAVAAADGWVYIEEMQMAGKRRMAIKDVLLGWRLSNEVFQE